MSTLELLLIALGLSMDAFAVSLGAGPHERIRGFRATFRLWFHFGLFQSLMTLVGWLAGASLESVIVAWDHWVAFGLLGLVGAKMVKEGLAGPRAEDRDSQKDPSRGLRLLSLSVATSLDALAVGLTLGMLTVPIWYPVVIIGLVTALLSLLGLRIGRVLGDYLGRWMEVAGGMVLLIIALRVVISG
jgi:manganese efflux pump family protein